MKLGQKLSPTALSLSKCQPVAAETNNFLPAILISIFSAGVSSSIQNCWGILSLADRWLMNMAYMTAHTRVRTHRRWHNTHTSTATTCYFNIFRGSSSSKYNTVNHTVNNSQQGAISDSSIKTAHNMQTAGYLPTHTHMHKYIICCHI